MANEMYERVHCVKNTVHVYKIPPRPSNRGYRAADWKLDQPDWTGRMRVVSLGKDLYIKLEDRNSGDLFAQCPVDQYPGVAVEAVTDSSRYFVIRIKDPSGRSAFIGIGFEDRGDSFDLNVALQDYFKHLKQEEEAAKAVGELQKGPKLDLGFKEGQTIKINIQTKKGDESGTHKPRQRTQGQGRGGSGLGLLPPPPGGFKINPPTGGMSAPQQTNTTPQHYVSHTNSACNVDLFDFDFSSNSQSSNDQSTSQVGNLVGFDEDFGGFNNAQSQSKGASQSSDPWGDFASANNSSSASNSASQGASTDWVQF
ncbi:hypothetical protein CHS0354_016378 [Potamilus streckersoni]|uniref:NECAP PHear domain-containing protein n=1 Tax=Potamilus streckersoni TaxID=2493646 RepID=A0AAE0W3H3_9BIVA|nr:hypothetical protein CHS0354_016378 [Potamilus streckersoni]